MAEEEKTDKGYGYGKRPLWQWILLYVVIGGIIYGLIYYFVLAKNSNSYNYGSSGQGSQQTSPYNYK